MTLARWAFGWIVEYIGLPLTIIVLGSCLDRAAAADNFPRVLILYPYDERVPATAVTGEAARMRLLQETAGKVEIFSEFLDASRFPEPENIERMASHLAEKYASRQPDVIIALGQESTAFIATNRSRIAPGATIVFCGFASALAAKMNLPADMVGAFSEFDIAKTLALARSLQPSAHRLFILGGSAEFDRSWLATARKELAGLTEEYETTYLENLTIDEFAERVANLPQDSIVLVLSILKDRAGNNFIPRDAVAHIAATASAPVYGPYSTYIGHGVVGGNSVEFEAVGQTVADIALNVIAGRPVGDVTVSPNYFADARQLEQWGLSERNLPPGTILKFKKASVWEQYWAQMLGVLFVVSVQTAVISVLLLERSRRRSAEQLARLRLIELVHLNQSATAGALSASIGHELNQPLGAIRSNTDAAEMLLQRDVPDLDQIRQILVEIRNDDQRASDILYRLSGLLKKRDKIDWEEFNLNEIIESSVKLLMAEATRRGVTLTFHQPNLALPVQADRVHVQQVILNLAVNAMDAVADAPTTMRKVVLQSMQTGEKSAEMSVSDCGPGIPPDQLPRVFDTFHTTKKNGMGLGLSIARSIIEVYGGKIWADNQPGSGAVFRFTLPLAKPI